MNRGLLVCCLLGLLNAGCSVLLDFSECKSNDDCAGAVCLKGVCERPACTTVDECSAHGAEFSCVRGSCFAVDEDVCTVDQELEPTSGEVLHIGALFPFTGRNEVKAEATYNGAKAALEQINNSHDGVRGVHLSMIRCDTENNAETAVEAGRYLIETVGVQSVIGSISSSETLAVANDVAIDAGTVMISPASTSPAISALDDRDLVWRTIASDALQGPALAWLVDKNGHQKVLVLRVQSAYGDGLFDAFVGSGIIDADRLTSLSYTVDAEGNLESESIVDAATDLLVGDGYLPDAIVIMGSVESQQLIFALDDTFFSELPEEDKPHWVLSEAGRDVGLLDARYSDVWPRIQGTIIQTVQSEVYDAFRLRFESRFNLNVEDHPFADKAFDAAWLLALAHGSYDDPIATSGEDLAARLAFTFQGDKFAPGDNLKTALDELASGGSIDYEGASGPVDFLRSTGDVSSDIASWAITTDAGGDPQFENVGVIYTSEGEQR